MHRAFALPFAFLVALWADGALAQTDQDCVITIHADGTCEATGLHVPCREIGPKLREAGIPPTASIRFSVDHAANYDAVSAALESVERAGLKMKKLGYIGVEPDR